MFRRLLLAGATVALTAPAVAAGSGNPFLERLVGGLDRHEKSFACFSRQYDDAHLAAHPEQKVAYMKMLVKAYYNEAFPPSAPGSYAYQVSLAFRLKERPETLTQVAECGGRKDSRIRGAYCAGPGDKGAHLTLDGKDAVVIAIRGGADLWAPGPIDQRHDTVKNPFGSDDKAFRLMRAGLKECEDLAFDADKPLRAREPR